MIVDSWQLRLFDGMIRARFLMALLHPVQRGLVDHEATHSILFPKYPSVSLSIPGVRSYIPAPLRAQMFPADFGHLCERLRRAQGRGPSLEKDRGSLVVI